jgi:HSF-type DNA-binding
MTLGPQKQRQQHYGHHITDPYHIDRISQTKQRHQQQRIKNNCDDGNLSARLIQQMLEQDENNVTLSVEGDMKMNNDNVHIESEQHAFHGFVCRPLLFNFSSSFHFLPSGETGYDLHWKLETEKSITISIAQEPKQTKLLPGHQLSLIVPKTSLHPHPLYHDFSNVTKMNIVGPKGGRIDSFPVVLHTILENVDQTSLFYNLIHWSEHGRYVVITNPKLFVEKVIPFYFKGQNDATFYRQISTYGFVSHTNGCHTKEKLHCYHAMFLRGHRHLTFCICRLRNHTNTTQ